MYPRVCSTCVALAVLASLAHSGCGMNNPNTGSATEVTLTVRPVQAGTPLADALVSVRRCSEQQAFCGGRTDAAGEFQCPEVVSVGDELCIYANCCPASFIGFETRDHVPVVDHGGANMVVEVDLNLQ